MGRAVTWRRIVPRLSSGFAGDSRVAFFHRVCQRRQQIVDVERFEDDTHLEFFQVGHHLGILARLHRGGACISLTMKMCGWWPSTPTVAEFPPTEGPQIVAFAPCDLTGTRSIPCHS